MRQPASSEQYVTIVDNNGRQKVQRVEYIVRDVRGEDVFVTTDGLVYTRDSLRIKQQQAVLAELDELPAVLMVPELVIWDPVDIPGETLIYYKQLYIAYYREYKVVAAIVKVRSGIKFFYNFFLQESGKVKGLPIVSPAEIEVWYIAPNVKRSQFGL